MPEDGNWLPYELAYQTFNNMLNTNFLPPITIYLSVTKKKCSNMKKNWDYDIMDG